MTLNSTNSLRQALESERITFLLGAGASKNSGVPLTNEFLPLIYYLTYHNQLELEVPPYDDGSFLVFDEIEKSCSKYLDLFSYGIYKELKNSDLSSDTIDKLVDYFIQRSSERTDYDEFIKTLSKEMVHFLFSSLKELSEFEKQIFMSIIKRFMFYLGRESFNQGVTSDFISDIKDILPNIEDLVSYADIASVISKNPSIASFFEIEDNVMKKLDDYSLFHIVNVLLYLTNNFEKNPLKGKNKEPYTSIAKFIENKGSSVLTFNYDTILESELNVLDVGYDYRINFDNEVSSSSSCYIYKLHGSLNWWKCPKCTKKYLTTIQDFSSYLATIDNESMQWNIGFSCCGVSMSPILIPPTMLKYTQDIDLLKLWLDASDELVTSQTIFVVGYSFPKEDLNVRNLIKSSLLKSISLKYIIYVGPDTTPLAFIRSIVSEIGLESQVKIIGFTNGDGYAENTIPKILSEHF